MNFAEVYLRGVQGIFTWEIPENLNVSAGSRVIVTFRGRKRIGLVTKTTEVKPDFKTQPVVEVLDEHFVPEKYLDIAREVSTENACSFEKIIKLMIPESFFLINNPEKREVSLILEKKPEEIKALKIRGQKQKLAIEIIKKNGNNILESELREQGIGLATLKGLIEKNIIKQEFGELIHGMKIEKIKRRNHDLTNLQKSVFNDILSTDKPTVLFGVTGSGKTEIYKKIAEEVFTKHETGQVLFLLPEIALTSQLIAEFRAMFGDRIAVWHSNMANGEKIQEWKRIRTGEANILIGARSAAFVPLKNPKLIILDEEHEWTFKSEFSPRVWTHDLVEKIAKKFEARLIFGSATPRLESFYKCEKGDYHLVKLLSRVHETPLPMIQMVDFKNEIKKGNYTPISEILIEELEKMKRRGKQAVFFLNRRGFSGSTLCKVCGDKFLCPHCDAPMKLHKSNNNSKFLCHVCGYMESPPEKCLGCGAKDFEYRGWGTQKVEHFFKENFPQFKVLRADADTVSGRYDFEKLLEKFHNKEADILLGTQMIAKGLDFEDVELVGVLQADIGLSLPDFRAEERVFQLLTQVSGRAGRRKNRGKIIIQSYNPEEKIFEYVQRHDTEGFINWTKENRRSTLSPPYSYLGKVTFSNQDKALAFSDAKRFFERMKKTVPIEESYSVHFAPAFFPKSHGKYHFHVVIKSPKREEILEFIQKTAALFPKKFLKVDIDPVSIL